MLLSLSRIYQIKLQRSIERSIEGSHRELLKSGSNVSKDRVYLFKLHCLRAKSTGLVVLKKVEYFQIGTASN